MICRNCSNNGHKVQVLPSEPTMTHESKDDQVELQGVCQTHRIPLIPSEPTKNHRSDNVRLKLNGPSPSTHPIIPSESTKTRQTNDVRSELHGPSPAHRNPANPTEPTKTHRSNDHRFEGQGPSMTTTVGGIRKERVDEPLSESSGREKLKKHQIDVAGRVWIPDIWGQEELLKDWIDCSAFDASLVPTGIMSARAALAEEGRRTSAGETQMRDLNQQRDD